MSAQRVSSRSRDSISSLPDEVLSKILSLLPHRFCHILKSEQSLAEFQRDLKTLAVKVSLFFSLVLSRLRLSLSLSLLGVRRLLKAGAKPLEIPDEPIQFYVQISPCLLSRSCRCTNPFCCRSGSWKAGRCIELGKGLRPMCAGVTWWNDIYVLSKRWKNLLPLVDSLDLSDAIGDPRGFSAFVDTTLALLTNSSIIKRFSLSCVHTDTTQPEWTLGFALPLSDSWNFTWRAHVCTPCEVYEYLISGCPVLEELFIRYASPSECSWMVVNQSIAVSSPSIKRMSISYPSRDYWEPPASEVFRTPSLVYLDHSGYVAGHYHVDLLKLDWILDGSEF
ncbi:hypothetical protein F2Q69_00011934 [Brassica cretica]|uniref:F-box domain-containing protein n=1 Tax=Brassica cretica TaxID=69181 RepID=A0A8S9QK25_BRACR|nr:hypothetical protein F2Q69_00011934 [Brassica cretica]